MTAPIERHSVGETERARRVQLISEAWRRAHEDDEVGDGDGLVVCCPHCRNPSDITDATVLSDITCPSCGGTFGILVEEEEASRIGTKLDSFELLALVGRGGFGSVWKAYDSELDREVAIKLPREGRLNALDAEHFFREARTAAQLCHPHIVSVHRVGRSGSTQFIVSDFVTGMSLAEWSETHKPTCREAAELVAKLSNALQHAHECGVIHRDVKPQNILIDEKSEPHLTDFGLARRDVGETTMTFDGHVLGTPEFMSPEQARGDSHQADERADIYSLGVVLFHLLTGELPFRGNVQMIVQQVLHHEAPSLRSFVATVPRDLETICLKCLEKDPQLRYQTAQQVCEELERFLSDAPIHARPISGMQRQWRWCRKNRLTSGLAAGFALALILGIAGVLYQWSRAEREAKRSHDFRYTADMNVVYQAWQTADVERAVNLLRFHFPPSGDLKLLGFRWRMLFKLVQRSAETPTLNFRGHAVFLPNGTLAHTDGSRARLRDIATGKELAVFDGDSRSIQRIAVSRDGKLLATRDGEKVRIWDVSTQQCRYSIEALGNKVAVFSPNGKYLAISHSDKAVQLLDMRDGTPYKSTLEGHLEGVAFSPDGQTLAVAGRDGVKLWQFNTDQRIELRREHKSVVECVAFSPDGKILVTGSADQTVKLRDTETHQLQYSLQGHTGNIRSVAFSPDGKILATTSPDNTVRLWDPVTGELFDTLRGNGGNSGYCLHFSPNGETLLTAGSAIKLWDVPRRDQSNTLRGHTNVVSFAAFSPEGRTLASGGSNGEVVLWDLDTNGRWQLADHFSDPVTGSISPDGSVLAAAAGDGTVKFWNIQQRRLVDELPNVHDEIIWSLNYSPDGKQLVSASSDATVKIIDIAAREVAKVLRGHEAGVKFADFSPSGELIASCSQDGTIRLWDVASDRETKFDAKVSKCWTVRFSPNGETLAVTSDNNVLLLDVLTGKLRFVLEGHNHIVMDVAFADDRTLASCSHGTIKLWDPVTGDERFTLYGSFGGVSWLTFSPDRSTLAACGRDGAIRLWRAATDDQIRAADWLQPSIPTRTSGAS